MRHFLLCFIGVVFVLNLTYITCNESNESSDLPSFNKNIKNKKNNEVIMEMTTANSNQELGTLKQKRCSILLKNANLNSEDVKQKIEQQKLESLCKFCKKSPNNMKLPMCKKCIEFTETESNSLEMKNGKKPSSAFLNNPLNTKDKNNQNDIEKKLIPADKLKSYNALANLNSLKTDLNVSDSGFQVNEKPTSDKQMIKDTRLSTAKITTVADKKNDEHLPQKGTFNYLRNDDFKKKHIFNDSANRIVEEKSKNAILEQINKKFHNEYFPNENNLLNKPGNSRTKRLKDAQSIPFGIDKILDEVLHSEEQRRNFEIHKRNLDNAQTKDNINKQIFNDILAKHILEIGSDSDDLFNSEDIFRIADENSPEDLSDKVTTEMPPIRIGSKYNSRFMYKKNPREKLKYRNGKWLMEKEPFTEEENKKFTVFENFMKNYSEQNDSQRTSTLNTTNKDETKEETTEKTTETNILLPRNEKSDVIKLKQIDSTNFEPSDSTEISVDLYKQLRDQYLKNKQQYLNDSQLESIYDNEKHKYVLKKLNDLNWNNFNHSKNMETSDKLKNTEKEIETEQKINSRSTREVEEPTTSSAENISNSKTPKLTKHEIIKKMLKAKQPLHNILQKLEQNKKTDELENPEIKGKDNKNEIIVEKQQTDIKLLQNRINLPLILKQNEDGSFQLILDKSQICEQCKNEEVNIIDKPINKRTTEEDLSKYPLNIFNIYDKNTNLPLDQSNNLSNVGNLKDQFYKYLINEELLKFFESLNIPVQSSEELRSIIDDLQENEKTKLKEYLLKSISNLYVNDDNQINYELFNQKQKEFLDHMLKKQINKRSEPNKISLKISDNDNFNDNILKSLIREEIQKEFENVNACPICRKEECVCNTNFPVSDNLEKDRVIEKRHNNYYASYYSPENDYISEKYKIFSNLINWFRDIVVPNKN